MTKDQQDLPVRFEPYGKPSQEVIKRFWDKVVTSNATECLEWTSAKTHSGHGRFSWKGRSWGAHRFAWYMYYNKSPENETLDHLCRNPSCVKIEHLEEVSLAENLARQAEAAEETTECIKGHSWLIEDNVYTNPNTGHKQCRVCNREYDRKRYLARYEEEKKLKTNSSEIRDFASEPKLDEEKVKQIRLMYSEGMSQRRLAYHFEVSQPMIGYITRNESWEDPAWDPQSKTFLQA